jgi:hypothetical protein
MLAPRAPRILAAAAAAALLGLGPRAEATIVSGPTMIDPPAALGKNPFQEKKFFAFYEAQDTVLNRDVKVVGGVVKSGELISSHYVLYDPRGIQRDTITITFDTEILGVITKNKQLKKSDFLGKTGISYQRFRKRGREFRDHFTISADGKSITFKNRASSPGDYMRIITRGHEEIPPPPPPPPIDPPPVPEPGAALLFGLGAALVTRATRRRRPSR